MSTGKGNLHGKQLQNISVSEGKLNIQGQLQVNNNIVAGVATPIIGTDGVNKDYVDNLFASLSITGGGGGVYANLNLNKDALITAGDGDLAAALGIAQVSKSGVRVFINGQEYSTPVNGASFATHDCYFQSATNSAIRSFGEEELTDLLKWNGTVAGFELAPTDEVDFIYLVGGATGGTASVSQVTSWLLLEDTPSAFVGQGDKFVAVNPGENSLIFVDGVSKYSETIVGPTASTYTITHNLGTTDILVDIWDLSDGSKSDGGEFDNRTTNAVDVGFLSPPSGDIRVVIIG